MDKENESWFKQHYSWLRESVKDFGKTDPLILASSVAFFTIFALPGVLVILLQVAAILFEAEEIRRALFSQASGLIGKDTADKLNEILSDAKLSETTIWQQVIGVAAILISATMAFVALQRGLNKIWGVKIKKGKGLKKQLVTRGIALLVMAGMSFLLPISLLFDDLIVVVVQQLNGGGIPSESLQVVIGKVISFVLMIFVMAVLYKVIPNAKVHWGDVWAGAVIAAVFFALGRYLVGQYISLTGIGEAFGPGQTVMVILVWMFMAAMITLFGAFHCHTVATARGHGIDPGRQAKAVDGIGERS